MLFYKGFQERIRHFMVNNDAYDEAIRQKSAWTVPDITAMMNSDQAVLEALDKGEPAPEPGSGEGEVTKYYTFNQTGNIMVSSTVPDETDINPDVKTLFQKVAVFFAAMTSAVASKQKTLYDYDAINSVVSGSGLFVNLHREDRSFEYSSTTVTLNSAIITAVLGGVAAGAGALVIAQQTIQRLGSEIQIAIEKSESEKKIAHLIFVCENLMGMPIVTATLFYVKAAEANFVTSTPCGSVSKTKIQFQYHQDTFMFVDPEYINQFTPDFDENPEYQALIERLADYIPNEG